MSIRLDAPAEGRRIYNLVITLETILAQTKDFLLEIQAEPRTRDYNLKFSKEKPEPNQVNLKEA